MPLPEPKPGLVIQYSYLWHSESKEGHESGVKDRPCVILSAFLRKNGKLRVVVIPVTTSKPTDAKFSAVEVPDGTKKRLGLRNDPMWFVCDDANEFDWAGPDLAMIPGRKPKRCDYGFLGQPLFDAIKNKFLFIAEGKKLKVAHRS